MKWFDSDYDYIDEFTTQWNERYKKIKRIGIILSVVLILIGILCFAFPEKVFTTIQIIAIIGNMIPVPFIYFFARKILVWGADKPVIGNFFTWCLEKGEKGGKKLQETAGKGLFVALLLFVGIPLPGTGAWTGTLAASILDMDFKSSVLAVMLGVILAGIIMALASMGLFGALGALF